MSCVRSYNCYLKASSGFSLQLKHNLNCLVYKTAQPHFILSALFTRLKPCCYVCIFQVSQVHYSQAPLCLPSFCSECHLSSPSTCGWWVGGSGRGLPCKSRGQLSVTCSEKSSEISLAKGVPQRHSLSQKSVYITLSTIRTHLLICLSIIFFSSLKCQLPEGRDNIALVHGCVTRT